MKKTPLLPSLKCCNSQIVPFFAVLALTINAHADSATWAGADGVWATLGNWSGPPLAVPGAADTATFSSTGILGTALAPINNGGIVNVNSILFDANALDYFLGGTINLSAGGGITVNKGNQTFGATTVSALGSATVTNNDLGTLSLGISSGVAGSTLTFAGTGNITATAQLAAAGNTTAVIKNGAGTLSLGNFSNTNIQGGFTINGGTVIAGNANSLSNRNLTLGGGTTIRMDASGAQSSFGNTAGTGVIVNGDTTWNYNVNTSQWRLGATNGAGALTSSNQPTVTITTLGGTGNIQTYLNTSAFDGTIKLGNEGVFALNHVNAAGGANFRVNMGDSASTGRHIFQTGVVLAVEGATQNIVPVTVGALSGTNTTALFAGRSNVGTRTTGTQYLVGGLGTSTSYAGIISDGVTTAGVAQSNGAADGTGSTRTNGVAGVQGTTEFVKTGVGTLTLTGASTHTGGTVIQGGTLAVNSDAALGATYNGSLRVFSYIPGTGVYTNSDLPDAVLTGGGGTGASVNVYSATLSNNANNNLFLSFSAQANDSAPAPIVNNVTGSGYISVPTVSFTGGTFLTAGNAPVASVRVQGLVTLDGGTLRTDAAINSNRAIVVGANGGTINTQSFSSTFSGNINGSGNLTLTGGGTVTLSGSNSYTGTTTVTGGTLATSGTGTLGNSNVALTNTGGVVLTLGSAVSFGDSNTLTFGSLSAINMDFTGSDSLLSISRSDIAQTLTAPGSYTATQLNTFFGVASFASATGGTFTVVPEPSAALLGGLGTLALLGRRRRR